MKRPHWAMIERGWWEYFPGDRSKGAVSHESDGWYSFPKGHDTYGPFRTATMAMRDVENLRGEGEANG